MSHPKHVFAEASEGGSLAFLACGCGRWLQLLGLVMACCWALICHSVIV